MAWPERLPPYLPYVLLGIALLVAAVWAYRSWHEWHEDLDPVTGRELLSEFEEAHAAGELDEAELRRVRELLDRPEASLADADRPRPSPKPKPAGLAPSPEAPDQAPPPAGPEGPLDAG